MIGEPGTILIVDDESTNRKVLRAQLLSGEYAVLEAANGPEALQKAEGRPDLILLDIMMPDMNGMEVCRRLKANETTHDIPVIFLSALRDTGTRVEGLRLGGVDFVSKPFDAAELLARVKTHITLSRQERELSRYARDLEQMVAEKTEQLIHADRLATLGTFAAAIVHEINSPLTYIGGNAELLQLFWCEAGPLLAAHAEEDRTGKISRYLGKVDGFLASILDGRRRISEIVDSLRTYAKKDGRPKEPCCLREPIEDAVGLLRHRFRGAHSVSLAISPDVCILGNRQQITQVFINLFNNSLDAMGAAGGQIHVEGGTVKDCVQVQVSDNGPGIPETLWETVFSSFVTTKGEERGTGLGLYIVRNIIEEHGGRIDLCTNTTKGATFHIELPVGRMGDGQAEV
jgi:two-component system, NtrC family, sensor kinase